MSSPLFQGSSTSPIVENLENDDLSEPFMLMDQDEEDINQIKEKGVEEEGHDNPFQKKKRKKTAKCWEEMEEIVDNKGKKMAKCKYCKKSWLVNKTSTTIQFNRHLANCTQRKLAISQNQPLRQQVLSFTQSETDGASSLASFTYDHAKVRELASHMVLIHEYPFFNYGTCGI